ncbi:MAG: hypothetical protein IKD93_01885 [Firmicutes bacterium]|nr:hypothetical protein [Bacillota bacterium]
MKLNDCIKNVSTFIDLKRFANEYVIDFKRLSFEELKVAVIKTAPQYYNEDNIRAVVRFFELHNDRNIRILFNVFVKNVLLNCDDFTEEVGLSEDKIIAYEKDIVDTANEFSLDKEVNNIGFYKYIVEAAWDNNDDVSVDEQNLINKIKLRLGISEKHHQILEAQMGKFPTQGNIIHSKDDIAKARRLLQSKGIIISIRDTNGADYDIIPTEIAECLRKIFNIDIKESSFKFLLDSKYVRNKAYLIDLLTKANVTLPSSPNLAVLKELAARQLTAHQLLGGFSANDGLDKATLSNWCNSLQLSTSGTKPELINRIIAYYDEIKQIQSSEEDEREVLFKYYCELASRNLSVLRHQGIIDKDLECEHKFEIATNYIFEKIFKIKPLIMSGTEHPDGILSFNDKLIMWDNKSKESPVSLAEHIKQFDRYIKKSVKPVSVFMVIGPSFTDDSQKECAKYAISNDTIILLITAEELKNLADLWLNTHKSDSDPLPLGIFKQNGRFNPDLLTI